VEGQFEKEKNTKPQKPFSLMQRKGTDPSGTLPHCVHCPREPVLLI